MPVSTDQPISTLTEQEFHKLDSQVMRWAFDIHNELGRFCDEKIYKTGLLNLCKRNGLNASTEVEIRLSHKTFSKSLFIDLLIEHGGIYELKTTKDIGSQHRAQALTYLFLSDTKHGKIINLRPPSVTYEFVSTSLSTTNRKNFTIRDPDKEPESETGWKLKNLMLDLLNDWGAFLDTEIYKEALCHFFGGLETVTQSITITHNQEVLGSQKVSLLSKTEMFCISSVTKEIPTYQTHLQRFLSLTRLNTLYWINLNRSEIQFSTIHNPHRKLFCP